MSMSSQIQTQNMMIVESKVKNTCSDFQSEIEVKVLVEVQVQVIISQSQI